MKKFKQVLPEIFLAMLFSVITIFGRSYKLTDSWNLVFNELLKNTIIFILYLIIYFFLIIILEKIFEKVGINKKIKSRVFDNHPFLIPMSIILLCWLPWIIIKYPGTPGWDFYYMLNNFYGLETGLTQHFPLFYVYMCGYIAKFGVLIDNTNLALYILSLLHGLSMLLSFSITFVYFKKWNINYKYRWFVLLFFCINPIFCNYSVTIYHDVIYSSFILIYVLLLTDIVMYKNISKKKILVLAITALAICLTRKNGIYIIIPTQLFILFKFKVIKPKILLILPIIVFYLTESYFSTRYIKTSVLEAITIPIQTVSRYSRDYHKDISKSEKMSIDKILDYDKAAELYNPTLVDDVRNNLGNYKLNDKDLIPFFKTWIKLFFRHPDSYIQAVLNITYQLYYPFEKTNYIFMDLMDDENYYSAVYFYDIEDLKPARKVLKGVINNFEKIPLVKYIDDPGYYSWLLFLLIILVKKNKESFLPLIPLIMTFLCCLAGPAIDYHGRYTFPIIFSIFPLLAFYSKLSLKENK